MPFLFFSYTVTNWNLGLRPSRAALVEESSCTKLWLGSLYLNNTFISTWFQILLLKSGEI